VFENYVADIEVDGKQVWFSWSYLFWASSLMLLQSIENLIYMVRIHHLNSLQGDGH
jgi:hypothetical protein